MKAKSKMKAKSNSSTGVSKIVRTLPCPLTKLLPPKHRKALSKYLEHPPKVYRVTGGRGALKTSFASVLATVIAQTPDCHGGDILFLTGSRNLAGYAFDQFNWLFTRKFPTSYVTRDGIWNPVIDRKTEIKSFRFSGIAKDCVIISHVHFLPLDCPDAVSRFLAKHKDYSLVIAEDAESLDLDLVMAFSNCKKNVRTVLLYNAYSDFPSKGKSHPDARPYFRRVRPHVRFTYKDVPTAWLGKAFFDTANELRRLYPNVYRSEYLALPPKTKPTARQKKDLIAIIDDRSRSPRQRLDDLIAYKKKHLGLVGFHMTCCAKKPLTENERIVSFLRLERGILTGAIKERDVTKEVL